VIGGIANPVHQTIRELGRDQPSNCPASSTVPLPAHSRNNTGNDTTPAIRAPDTIPTTLRRPVCATSPVASTVNSVNVPRRRNTGRNISSNAAQDTGKIIVATYETGCPTEVHDTHHATTLALPEPQGAPIMGGVPDTPSQQTRTAVTQRIIAHVTRGWAHLGKPLVRHRGQFCYVAAILPGHREPTPILRLRYQGSAEGWAIAIYLASNDRYTESELPTSFGPKTSTPEQGIDHTFILYAGPSSRP
jgi:hypothetical protein